MNKGDLNRVSVCGNFQGNLIISPKFKEIEINLNHLRQVEDNLIVSEIKNNYIFKAPYLETVAGSMKFEKVTDLEKIDMPKLSRVENSIYITDNSLAMKFSLPNLVLANNIIIKSVSELNLDSLQIVTRSFKLFQSSSSSLSAPQLKLIGNTLTINGKKYLFPNT